MAWQLLFDRPGRRFVNSRIDPTLQALYGTLDRVSRRTSVTASNLANIDTPGYRAQRVVFPKVADAALGLERTSANHVGMSIQQDGFVVDAPVVRRRADGNTVDIDTEMTELAKLQGRYQATTQIVRKRFGLIRYAATDGRE